MFFIRRTQPTFTVSAAAVVLNEKDEVLLLNHILRPGGGWGLPGGFLDAGEQPADALRRELMEETGIELSDLRMFQVRTLGRHIEILFSARTNGDPKVMSREIKELGWFRPDAMPERLPNAQKRAIELVLSADGTV
jgi:ADP-ribose pyrophosphatase YjhB (NUDIX family)